MPSLAASPMLVTDFGTNTLVSGSFTPADNEVIVVCTACSDGSSSMASPTGGSLSFGAAKVSLVPGGFAGSVQIFAVQVGASPGAMTLSSAVATGPGAPHSMCISRYSNAALATTPAVGSAQGVSGSANSALTTTAANSALAWCACDLQSNDPASRAYLSAAVEDALYDGHSSSNGVHYFAHQIVAAAGAGKTFGTSAPTGEQYVIAGIEILDVPITWQFGYDVKIG